MGSYYGDSDDSMGEANMNDASASGTVTSDSGSSIGGLIGEAGSEDEAELHIQKVYADVTVTVNAVENSDIGGLIGYLELDLDNPNGITGQLATVRDAYSWGNVNAPGNWNVGGLIGRAHLRDDEEGYEGIALAIERTYSKASVVGYHNVGGLIGHVDSLGEEFNNAYQIKDNFVTGGTVTSDLGASEVGSLIGYDDNSEQVVNYENNYYDLGATQVEACVSNKTPEGCSPVNQDGSQSNYFINNTTNRPFTSASNQQVWNFDGTWVKHGNIPPTFGAVTANTIAFISPATNKEIILELSQECSFEAQFKQEYQLSAADVGYDYPNGLVGFSADCGTPGFTTTVSQYYVGVQPSDFVARKFSSRINGYFTLNDATIEQVSIDGQQATKVTYQVTDGSERDMDGKVDGLISDPAGLAQSIVGAPNTGL